MKNGREKLALAWRWRKTVAGAIAIFGILAIGNLLIPQVEAQQRNKLGLPLPGAPIEAADPAKMAFPLPDKPSIAVLPFDNFSGDPDQDHIADGLSEDITTALSMLPRFFVIARNSAMTYKGQAVKVQQVAEDLGVQYVLEGSIQREGDRMRVTAQLIDALNGRHIWADRYDRPMKDLFAVQDEITLNIVSNIGAELQSGEADRIIRHDTDSLAAWLLWKRAFALDQSLDQEKVFQAMDLYRQAIAIDPNFATARANLANAYAFAGVTGWMDAAKAYGTAEELINKALEIDPVNQHAYGVLALLRRHQGRNDLAMEAAGRAIELNPNNAAVHGILGFVSLAPGLYADAVRETRTAIRLSPYSEHWVYNTLGSALKYDGQYEEALEVLEPVLDDNPSPFNEAWARGTSAIALVRLGREDEARESVAKITEVLPFYNLSFISASSQAFRDKEVIAAELDILRRLGLPE